MADPLLSTLCQICHISPPKYTCPRCHQQTCSLPCSKRHKLWSSCNGIRDPTVFKPIAQLATPSGIDHDYNFLHGIEHKVERSEKEIAEHRGLVIQTQVKDARTEKEVRAIREVEMKDEQISKRLRELRIEVLRAPRGLGRSMENGTDWWRKRKCIYWQVEWMRICRREGQDLRVLDKVVDDKPVGKAYEELCGRRRREQLGEEKRAAEKRRATEEIRATRTKTVAESKSKGLQSAKGSKKRKAKRKTSDDAKESKAKRSKVEESPSEFEYFNLPILQDPQSGAWNVTSGYLPSAQAATPHLSEPINDNNGTVQSPPTYRLYLHRPLTPSSLPKVLVPLDHTKSLAQILRYRVILEFPSIYVMDPVADDLPEGFMLEREYADKTGQAVPQDTDMDVDMCDGDFGMEDDNETSSSAISSSSGEDMEDRSGYGDECMEEGEILSD